MFGKRDGMKKKVAVFANGWSNEYLELTIEGMRKRADEENIDLFVFVNYSAGEDDNERDNIGERGMFTLPDLSQFDGVVLFGNIINMEWERTYLKNEIQKAKIPAVCLEYEMDDIPCIETDTFQGFYELVSHVIEVHHAKKILYVNGPRHNKECIIRRKAVEAVLEKNALVLREADIIHAEWSYQTACANMREWIHAHDYLPDAVICANDEMAMGICTALNCEGVEVPGQVIVIGFDFVADGQRFFPMLSTVRRDWTRLGVEGMELLLRQMDGHKVSMKTRIPCQMEIGESCGCCADDEKCKMRLNALGESYRKKRQQEEDEWHLRYIDDTISKITDSQSLKKSLQEHYEENHTFEGEDFLLCLEENFFDSEEREDKSGELNGWMEVFVKLENGKSVSRKNFPVGQILKECLEECLEEDKTHIFLFAGLHEFEHCFGYIMQKDFMDRLYDKSLYSWIQRLSQDMMKVKQNIRLEDLNRRLVDVSITDKLTGLKNRTGFEMKALPYLQKCRENHRDTWLVFADINQMKIINDQLGHLQGDMALCIVAEAIRKTIPKEWVAVRYGGDEFIVVGAYDEFKDIDEMRELFTDNLNRLKERNAFAFPLTVSLGAVVMRSDEVNSLDEYMRRADEAMYIEKQKFHNKE